MALTVLSQTLDDLHRQGSSVRLWLRDDDAVSVTPALEVLLEMLKRHNVPALIAVIPRDADEALARRLATVLGARVAVHGWAHANHAPPSAKSAELGDDRAIGSVIAELEEGQRKLSALFGAQLSGLLVPPWNRIGRGVAAGLPQAGFGGLSVFGRETYGPLPMVNTHVDLIDWRGTRGGRDAMALTADFQSLIAGGLRDIGLLTHHLVHDAAAWRFLESFLALTAAHPAATWVEADNLLAERQAS